MILATAFTAFGGAETNASELLLRALADDVGPARIVRAVLPVEYERGSLEIVRLIRELRPDAVVCFGVAGKSETLRLERVARNWDASEAADNAGEIRNERAIVAEGPGVYGATLPYDAIAAALEARGIPYVFSDDAGGYVCNHTFFCARHEMEQSGLEIPCGFVHVPPIRSGEQFAMLLEAMRICIGAAPVSEISQL